MKAARYLACVVLIAVCALSLAANWLAPADYSKQFRETPLYYAATWNPARKRKLADCRLQQQSGGEVAGHVLRQMKSANGSDSLMRRTG